MDFQIFNPPVIPSEGPTLDATRVLLKHEMLMASQKCKKIKTGEEWVGYD